MASLTPCGPWQIAQRCASVAPRPIDTGLGRVSISDVITTFDVLKSGWTELAWGNARHTGGAADRVPDAAELEIGLRERQPDQAGQRREHGDHERHTNACAEPGISQREQRLLAHRPRSDIDRGHVGFSTINWAIG